MGKGTVVDTCALVDCFCDLLIGEVTVNTEFLSQVFARGYIAIDSQGKALHEYSETARPGALRDGLANWIAERVRVGQVLEFDIDNSLNRALNQLGLPKKDLKWVGIALGSGSHIIVSHDIDLFDPSEKGCDAKRRKQVMSGTSGAIASFCKKKLGIIVTTCENYDDAVSAVD
jgi:hypothetical protein